MLNKDRLTVKSFLFLFLQVREEVKTRPPFSTHVPELVHWIDVSDPEGLVLLLAHNGHKFDHRILKHHIQEFGLQVPPNWYFVDTLPMARENAQGLRSYSLLNLARTFLKEDPQGLHAADEDVRFLWRVMEKLVDKKGDEAVRRVGQLALKQVFGREFLNEPENDLEEGDFLEE